MEPARRADRNAGRNADPTAPLEAGFLKRAYRTTLALAAIGLLYLWGYGLARLIFPAALGVGVGIGFLYGADVLVRAVFTAPRAQARNKKQEVPRIPRRTLAQVTIKYLSAILLLWYIARNWDLLSIAAFVCGVCLVQVSIVARALSRALLAHWGQGTK